jgi:glycerate 2-kinase
MTRTPAWKDLRGHLAALHHAAMTAADPFAAVANALGTREGSLLAGGRELALHPDTRIWMMAFGKAAPDMARAAIARVGPRLAGGVLAHPAHARLDSRDFPGFAHFAAGHPLPDEGSLAAGEAALGMLSRIAPDDIVLVLVSGGGSALFEALLPGVTLDQLRRLTESLMLAGADIVELNTVRRCLSRIKAGGLSRACGAARVVTLILSDVVGDRLETIASGPTIEAPLDPRSACRILERRGLIESFPSVVAALARTPPAGASSASTGDRVARIVGSNRGAAEAVVEKARGLGFSGLLLTDRLQGEAREVGRLLGGIARSMADAGLPLAAPACLVLGGETTVTVRGKGRGGRSLELVLGAALTLEGSPRTALFAFATDGLDGSSRAAGAIATGETLARAAALGLDAQEALRENDSEAFFDALGDLWVTGGSGTNVNDLAVVLVYGTGPGPRSA